MASHLFGIFVLQFFAPRCEYWNNELWKWCTMLNVGILETGPERYQPNRAFMLDDNPVYVLNQQKLAFMVGLIAILMPVGLYLSTWTGVCFYHSISHFYFSRIMGGVFVGSLAFIGAFLLAYRGENRAENNLATLAGICAFGVALFPTSGRGCDAPRFMGRPFAEMRPIDGGGVIITPPSASDAYFQMFPGASVVHYLSAALLFAFLAWYSFAVFTRVIDSEHRLKNGQLKPEKLTRNILYVVSGLVIVMSMLAMAVDGLYEFIMDASLPGWNENRLTFWFETFALWAFGLSWIVRGRFFGRALLDEKDRRARSSL